MVANLDKQNKSMLNAMPSQISSNREQPDIITRRHKVSGSGGL